MRFKLTHYQKHKYACLPSLDYVLIPFVSQIASPTPADRFARIIEGMCLAVARRGGLRLLAGPLVILIWSRLRRIAARFTRHGTTPPLSCPAAKRQAAPREAASRQARLRQAGPNPLPRCHAWLLRLVPETASGASQLRHFLADPEVTALLAETPQLRRILRPLCRMLGIRPTQVLRPPPTSPADAAPAPTARPIPSQAPPPAEPAAVPLAAGPLVAIPPQATPPPVPA